MTNATISEPGPQQPRDATRQLLVSRRKPGWSRSRVDEFVVSAGPDTTVLDALRDIRLHHDRSLTLRYSCCHASCGTCGLRVNGREVLACVTRLADLGAGPVTVEPLANAQVTHDLVVDMRDFYARVEPAGRPLIRQDRPATGDGHASEGTGTTRGNQAPAPGSNAGDPFARYEDCIECGLCVSACPVAGTDPRYIGPAGLAAAARLVAEPRGADPSPVLAWVDDEQGCWRCHASFECTEACPSGADPAGAIMRLRRELTQRKLGRLARTVRRRGQ